jgi:hypothetical protein
LEDVESVCGTLLVDLKKKVNVRTIGELFSSYIIIDTKITRQVMAGWLQEASDIIKQQASLIRSYKDIIDEMKNEAIADKTKAKNVQEIGV